VGAPFPSQPMTRENATETTRRHIRFFILLFFVSSEAFPFVWQNSLSVKRRITQRGEISKLPEKTQSQGTRVPGSAAKETNWREEEKSFCS